MAWDDTHQTAADPDNPDPNEEITATEWNNMVADQKGHAARHEDGGADEIATLGDITVDDLDGARIVRDIANLNQAIRDASGESSTTLDGGTIVYLAPPENPEDSTRPNTHFPDGETLEDRTAGIIGKRGVVVKGLTKPEFTRGPMQGTGQNQVVVSARDMPEGTATGSGGDPRDWPTMLYPEPKLPSGGSGERAVAHQFRNLSIDGEGKRVNGYYARNCDKGVVAGINVTDTIGMAFGWSGAFSMHAYRVGAEDCGSLQEGIDAGSGPFNTSEQNSNLTPGVPAVYTQEGQDSLARNINVRISGFFQYNGDDAPTQMLCGPGGTMKIIGDKKYRTGAIIRNAGGNTTVHAVVDIRGNRVARMNVTGGSGNGQALIGMCAGQGTEIRDCKIEKLPEGIRWDDNPTQSPPVSDLLIQDISPNGTLSGDAMRVAGASGSETMPDITDSLFLNIDGAVVRFDSGNPGDIKLTDCRFDQVAGYIIEDNRGAASQDSYKEITGRANALDRDASGLSNNGVAAEDRELAWVDLPNTWRNYFYDVISASNGDTIAHNMDITPDLVQVTTESANVAGISAKSASDVTLVLEDGNGNAVTVDEPIHCAFRHASAMRQTRTERTINS